MFGRDWPKELRDAIEAPYGTLEGMSKENLSHEPQSSDGSHLPVIDAETIRHVLADKTHTYDPTGLVIRNVRIEGALCLDDLDLEYPVLFDSVLFDSDISLAGIRAPAIRFLRCVLQGINLRFAQIEQDFVLNDCRMRGNVRAELAKFGSLSCQRSQISLKLCEEPQQLVTSLELTQIVVAGDLNLGDSSVVGGLNAFGARVGGKLSLNGIRVSCCSQVNCGVADHRSVTLDGARIDGGVRMQGFRAQGPVMALRAYVGGEFHVTRAVISGGGSAGALNLGGLELTGPLQIEDTRMEGGLDIDGASLHEFMMLRAEIRAPGRTAIAASGVRCRDAFEVDSVNALGSVSLRNSTVGKDLRLKRTNVYGSVAIDSTTVSTVDLSSVSILIEPHRDNLYLAPPKALIRAALGPDSKVESELFSSTVPSFCLASGETDWKRSVAKRTNYEDIPWSKGDFTFNGSQVAHDAVFAFQEVAGDIVVREAVIGGQLQIGATGFHFPIGLLNIGGSQVTRDLTLTGSGFAKGIQAQGLSVGGTLDWAGVIPTRSLVNWRELSPMAQAPVDLAGAVINKLSLGNESQVSYRASVDLSRAAVQHLETGMKAHKVRVPPHRGFLGDIGSSARRIRSSLTELFRPRSRQGDAVIASSGSTRGGGRALERSRFEAAADEYLGLPRATRTPSVAATKHWSIGSIDGIAGADWKGARDWLELPSSRQGEFIPQLWFEVADVFDRSGRESEAKKLRFEAVDRVLWRRTNVVSWLWGRITKVTIGHGFYPERALVWLLIIWFSVAGLVASNKDSFSPSDRSTAISQAQDEKPAPKSEPTGKGLAITGSTNPSPIAYPTLYPFIYAVDIVVSPVGTGQSTAWQFHGSLWLSSILTFLKLLSWALGGLFITGIAGAFRRR